MSPTPSPSPLDQKKGARVLVLSYSDLPKDARLLRQIGELLRLGATVSTGAHVPSGLENGSYVHILHEERRHYGLPAPIRKIISATVRLRHLVLRSLNAHDVEYWSGFRRSALRELSQIPADLIIANDIDTLPLALALKKPGTKVIFDAHEYSPLQGEGNADWMKSFHARNLYLCKKYMPQADQCFTVSPEIVDLYKQITGVQALLMTNAPAYEDLHPIEGTGKVIKLVHHGIATPQRDTHALVRMMDQLGPDYHLTLYINADQDHGYANELARMCEARENVDLYPGVPPQEITRTINQFDIGVHRLPPTSTNHDLALPNKFFEFIQARLAMVISPGRSMARIVREEGLGAVAKDHGIDAMVEAIRSLDRAQIMDCKKRAHTLASRYSAESNMALLRDRVTALLSADDAAARS